MIVVDEFATLVKEVPEFVAGVVDIAQRGRSLGVHLILATQRPSGSVNDNILANTNLRISLRMLDASESKTVIGVGAAADIPLPLKGRGFARLGPERPDRVPVGVHRRRAHPGRRRQPRRGAPVRQRGPSGRHHDHPVGASHHPGRPHGDRRLLPSDRCHPGRGRRRTARTAERPPLAVGVGRPPPAPADRRAGTAASPDGAPAAGARSRPAAPAVPAPAPPPPGVGTTSVVRGRGHPPRRVARRGRQGGAELADAAQAVARDAARGARLARRSSDPRSRRRRGARVASSRSGCSTTPRPRRSTRRCSTSRTSGGLLIGGSGGAGKTTALRTAAMAAVVDATPDEVTLFVIDCRLAIARHPGRPARTSRRSPRATTSSR